jgi:hypothetical protein
MDHRIDTIERPLENLGFADIPRDQFHVAVKICGTLPVRPVDLRD